MIPIAPVPMDVDIVQEPSVAIPDQEVEDQQPLSPIEEPFIHPKNEPTYNILTLLHQKLHNQ